MKIDFFQTITYKKLIQKHISETLVYLFENNQSFAIACELKYIDFSPNLPESIFSHFGETVLFVINGYTFETATIDEENNLSFEAGFGEDNFGSLVTISFLAIKQIIVEDMPILLNSAEPLTKDEKDANKSSSMEKLLKNPQNKKLLKKNKP